MLQSRWRATPCHDPEPSRSRAELSSFSTGGNSGHLLHQSGLWLRLPMIVVKAVGIA